MTVIPTFSAKLKALSVGEARDTMTGLLRLKAFETISEEILPLKSKIVPSAESP